MLVRLFPAQVNLSKAVARIFEETISFMQRTPRILWADDEIDLLKPHLLFLEGKGFHVTAVNSGVEALEKLGAEVFDLVFLDEQMPGLNGLETLARIKDQRPHLPVIMITKSEEEHIMEEAIGSKISDYLIKPVNPNQILLAIKKNLDERRLVSEKAMSDYQREFREISMQLMDRLDASDWTSIFQRLVHWKLELEQSDLSRELLSCPVFAARKSKRGWKRLQLPWETVEQPPRAAAPAPQAVPERLCWDRRQAAMAEVKAQTFGAGVRGGLDKMRERLAAKGEALFERLKKENPSFVPHCKVFEEVKGVMWITCSNAGCKLKCRSKKWNTKKTQSCPDKGAVALRQEARFRMRTEAVAERDSQIFEQQRKLNPGFIPYSRASVECHGRIYYVARCGFSRRVGEVIGCRAAKGPCQ